MKKFLIAIILILPLVFASCSGTEETTEPETHPMLEITTSAPLRIEEMSPSYMEPVMSRDVPVKVSEIDFSAMEEIEAKDSFLPEAGHDKILKDENVQYFFVTDDIKIHAVYCDDKGVIVASASYNTDTGYLEFFGDADFTWYYENGELEYFVYSYKFGTAGSAPIYTFYNSDGSKEVTRTADGWYTPSLDILTNEEILEYLEKYDNAIEATAEY